jgi:TldD protein
VGVWVVAYDAINHHEAHPIMFRSRREFVKLASTAAAAGIVWPARSIAQLDPTRTMRDAFGGIDRRGPEPHALAAAALDAARKAGATFADVRVDRQIMQSIQLVNEFGGNALYSEDVGVGVRVIANGQWGFVSVESPTIDDVVEAARRAVHQAQVNAKGRVTQVALAPTSVAKGTWATPVRTDPFAIVIGEQQEALLAGAKAALAISGVKRVDTSMEFLRVDRTFASTEGSEVAQTFSFAFPGARVYATVLDRSVQAMKVPEGWDLQAAGYEALAEAKLPDKMRAAADAAMKESKARLAGPKPTSVDVGRYELVVGPQIFSGMVQGTVIAALQMERALGKRSNEEGTSYAAPPDKVLGTLQVATPLLAVRGDRTTPGGLMTVGWDDEGVAPEEFKLVDKGVVTDFLANRENTAHLAAAYSAHGHPTKPHGCAASPSWSVPQELVPNLTIAPGAESVTVEDMIKDVKRGIYLTGSGGASGDFGLTNAYGGGDAQEIRDGKLGAKLADCAIQFQVQSFWKGLLAVGGASSVETFVGGYPGLFQCRTIRSVPARFKEVNVVNTGRTQ